ncbi:MAG: tRNA (N6-isopentenyl adenosine(37)-C2)-methylthiotransferase MiaB [Deltaproteobacteria bacterium]|nr:tRNA (N6-isopentenyl adenosine(37)-C2)-methylthiotransferase MiaB [Deltaproteobacteria bacterium]
MPRKFYITTMGCQMNEYDSDYLSQLLLQDRFEASRRPEDADLIMINTCTVRRKAEQKAYSLLGRMVSIKRKRPDTIIGLVGCIAQQEGAQLLERFPGLDFVLGTREIGRIGEVLDQVEGTGERIAATDLNKTSLPSGHLPGYFAGKVKGYLSIMEGCDNFCSYCIVPYVRGREVSRPPKEILSEAKSLVSQGVKEITLLGQNVNSYRPEEDDSFGFPSLLRELEEVDGLRRIRFTTSHPKDLSDDLIRCFRELRKLCPHIHLPVQSGSNRVLKLMNRGYTREKYAELIQRLRDARPDIAVTSDIIVGFPGESDEDFHLTLDLIRKIQFDSIYSFKYSDRKGTPAASLGHKVSEEIKAKRLSTLQALQKSITLSKNKLLEGKEVEVLVEGPSKRGRQLTGRTDTNKVVNFNHHTGSLGELVKVKIKRSFANSLRGEISSTRA